MLQKTKINILKEKETGAMLYLQMNQALSS